jgi:alkaline phosphatase
MQNEIAEQLATSSIDFFAGGGLQHFYGREDNIDVLAILSENGFAVDTSSLTGNLNPDSKYGFLLAQGGMPRMLDGRSNFLADASRMALNYFEQKNESFFLMIEGSQIDWGGHDNNAEYLVSELLDFEKVIGLALDFAEKDGNTLVIVTADHETGGFTLAANKGNYNDIKGTFSTGGHSTTLIPVFAYGPGSDQFRGVYQNSEIFDKMLQAIADN